MVIFLSTFLLFYICCNIQIKKAKKSFKQHSQNTVKTTVRKKLAKEEQTVPQNDVNKGYYRGHEIVDAPTSVSHVEYVDVPDDDDIIKDEEEAKMTIFMSKLEEQKEAERQEEILASQLFAT